MLIHQFPPISGGAELQAECLAIKLTSMDYPIEVLTRLLDNVSAPQELIGGVKVMRVTFPFAYAFTGNEMVRTFRYLVENRHKYDIFHAHQAWGHAAAAVLVARCFHKKSIVKVACAGDFGDIEVLKNLKGGRNGLRILRQVDAIIAVSQEVEKELLRNGFSSQRIYHIPNGVDTDFFKRNDPFPPWTKIRFILVGRRHYHKGIDIALQALSLIKKQGLAQRIELRLYGRDFEGYDYRKMAVELGLDEMVEFLPFSDDIYDVYQSAHVFILPSRGEGLSNSLLEAMSMELPVIATRVSGTTDVVEDEKDGLLIPPESAPALAHAMLKIIQEPEFALKIGQNARQKVLYKFSLDIVAQQYADLYQKLCPNSKQIGKKLAWKQKKKILESSKMLMKYYWFVVWKLCSMRVIFSRFF